MGLYLSCLRKPITKKCSADESNNKLNCGASAMQGWRDDQEDAHNCVLDYDTDTSYFAVYDGHGGGEVAKYCANYLPDFLKELEDYKNGNYEKALEEAYLQFDATIISEETNATLKKYRKIARKYRRSLKNAKFGCKDDDIEEEDEEHVKNLYEEAAMPIEKVIEKYEAQKLGNNAVTAKKEDTLPNKSNADECSTSHIPESSGEVVSSTSNMSSKHDNSKDNESPVSSGSCSKESNESKGIKASKEVEVDSPDSSGDAREECTPSDETDRQQISDQNGLETEPKENCESTKSDVTSSSTTEATPQENGEVTRKGKALTKTKGVVPKPEPRPKRTAQQLYSSLLTTEDCSDEESEDEKDETFEGQNDDSSDDADSKDDEEEEKEPDEEDEDEEISDAAVVKQNSDESDSDSDIDNSDKIGIYTGSTAVVALLKGNDLYVANAGDSRCVVCRNGEAIEMSFDHKPEDKTERSRILKAGGFVDSDGRVNGGLNLSRAIGDFHNKRNKKLSDREQMITALPDVRTLKIKPGEDEFMVLACDGIWNSLSNQEVVNYVRTRIREGREKLSQICEEMFNHCLAPDLHGDGAGCDNMTAIIVAFKTSSLKRSSFDPEEPEHNKKSKIEEPQVSTET